MNILKKKSGIPKEKSSVFFIALLITLITGINTITFAEIDNRKQRHLVDRFYQILEKVPYACPKESRIEFLKTADRFRNAYPEFNALLHKSRYREYAFEKHSKPYTLDSLDSLDNRACLHYKAVVDEYINTDKGKKNMQEYLNIMHN